jgi:hypothetical protein
MATTYTPALSQAIQTTNQPSTGRMRWGNAIYAADGTLLDFIPYNDGSDADAAIGYPKWVEELAALPPVIVPPAEFKRWLRNRVTK